MGSRTVPYDPEAICDECGKKGALDFMGDIFCCECIGKFEKELDDDDLVEKGQTQ